MGSEMKPRWAYQVGIALPMIQAVPVLWQVVEPNADDFKCMRLLDIKTPRHPGASTRTFRYDLDRGSLEATTPSAWKVNRHCVKKINPATDRPL